MLSALIALAVLPACDISADGHVQTFDAVCVEVSVGGVMVGITDAGTHITYSIPAYLQQIAAGE